MGMSDINNGPWIEFKGPLTYPRWGQSHLDLCIALMASQASNPGSLLISSSNPSPGPGSEDWDLPVWASNSPPFTLINFEGPFVGI